MGVKLDNLLIDTPGQWSMVTSEKQIQFIRICSMVSDDRYDCDGPVQRLLSM